MTAYADRVRWSPHRIDMSRAMFGVSITPLHDVVAPTLERLPADIGAQLRRDFWKRHDASQDWDAKHAAQDWLANQVKGLEASRLHIAFDDWELQNKAKYCAELCSKMISLEAMEDFARDQGIDPPATERGNTRAGRANRIRSNSWWLHRLRRRYRRDAESRIRGIGTVHRRGQVYASDLACTARRTAKRKTSDWLRARVAVSDAGDQLELFDVVAASQANPVLRRNELMVRMRGFDEVAQIAGHAGLFITLTCPSAYHATLENGHRNTRFRDFSPRDGQSWLCRMWARARSKLDKLKIRMYGFRVAEPHHDGTPHWHAVLFAPARHIDQISFVLRSYWLSEYSDEPGAASVRVKFKALDRAKGTGAGYLSKYIAKNIDGFEVGDDYETEGQQASESCERVAAWASIHGIRQFQQIGGPPVSVWREVRRLRDRVVPHAAVEATRKAADAGEWAEFIAAIGGIERGRSGTVRLWTECTGELNQYGELRGPQIAGVQAEQTSGDGVGSTVVGDDGRYRNLRRVRTREKVWRIERKCGGAAPSRCYSNGGSGGDSKTRGTAGSGGAGSSVSSASSVSDLGPVSITVRGSKTMPGESSTGARGSGSIRGSPWTH